MAASRVVDFLRKKLGIEDLERQLCNIERRVSDLENQAGATLKHFGQYRPRTAEELHLMRSQLEDLLAAVDALVTQSEDQRELERAKRLRKRLNNNLTRIKSAQAYRD